MKTKLPDPLYLLPMLLLLVFVVVPVGLLTRIWQKGLVDTLRGLYRAIRESIKEGYRAYKEARVIERKST